MLRWLEWPLRAVDSDEMQDVLISVHIPKTAGTSFRRLLRAWFGERLFEDYEDRVLHVSETERVAAEVDESDRRKRRLVDYDCIHGHFMPQKYDIKSVRRKSYVVWLRDPVERAVSRYFHGRRVREDPAFQHDISLAEFAGIARFHNAYSKYFGGFDLQRFDFLGISEDFDSEVARFAHLFELTPLPATRHNSNPDRRGDLSYELSPTDRELLIAANQADIDLVARARTLNAAKG